MVGLRTKAYVGKIFKTAIFDFKLLQFNVTPQLRAPPAAVPDDIVLRNGGQDASARCHRMDIHVLLTRTIFFNAEMKFVSHPAKTHYSAFANFLAFDVRGGCTVCRRDGDAARRGKY